MGKKKFQVKPLTDDRARQVTFSKRKFGMMKKAYELSTLCHCDVGIIFFSRNNKLYQYASSDMDQVLQRYAEFSQPDESFTSEDIRLLPHYGKGEAQANEEAADELLNEEPTSG